MAKPSIASPRRGGIKLFQIAGIDVFLHWSWILVAVFEVQQNHSYKSPVFAAMEYLALFLIVLLHEFGHAFACRSVGGIANRIVLWPLGGVAYVQPPMRPGAWLWSIFAGPLVNIALLPITVGVYFAIRRSGAPPDLVHLTWRIGAINALLLAFNLLPIYPLDGGKILQALLWFIFGQVKSLMIAATLGIVCAVGGIGALLVLSGGDIQGNIWLVIMGFFAVSQSILGLKYAKSLSGLMSLPRHADYHCPACRQSPPAVEAWGCRCGNPVDIFAAGGTCPHCGTRWAEVPCVFCGLSRPFPDWYGGAIAPPLSPSPVPATPA